MIEVGIVASPGAEIEDAAVTTFATRGSGLLEYDPVPAPPIGAIGSGLIAVGIFAISNRMSRFPFKRLELELPENGGVSFGLIGASRSGKTTLMKYLFRTYFSKHITVMTTMNAQAAIYKDLDSNVIIARQYFPEILREFHDMNELTDNKYDFLFISDDCVEPKIKNDQEVTRALTIYRNAGVSSIWSFQGRTLMNAVGRNNLNYIAILKQNTPKEWEAVIKEFLAMYLPSGMTMAEMIEFCKRATEDHRFFFCDTINGECYLTKLTPEQAGVA